MITTHSKRTASVLAGLLAIASAGSTLAAPPPGPPWPSNAPNPNERPASDAPAKDFTVAEIEANGAPVGIGVTVAAAIAKPRLGDKYELYYQFRVHTRKGETGLLLATPESPTGKAVFLKQVTCAHDWIEFYEKFDVTRKDLSGLLNLPARAPGESDLEVMIRVEPQLYDVAEKKYLTPAKTPAAILIAGVGTNGKVWSVQSLSGWLVEKSRSGSDPGRVLDRLADLDDFDPTANGVEDAILRVLRAQDVPAETRILFIRAIVPSTLNTKSAFPLRQALEELASGADAGLKSAARKKLDEAK